jgi:hypothetical protein
LLCTLRNGRHLPPRNTRYRAAANLTRVGLPPTGPRQLVWRTQKKTFEAAALAQAQAIIQLKDNQPTLIQNAETACARQHPTSSDTSLTKARNRREIRTVDVFSATRAVADTEWKHLIKGIVRVTRDVLHRSAKTGLWSSTSEVAYYLVNFAESAGHASIAIRNHWNIENTLHYTRDVTFQEDRSRIRCNPGVFARIRSWLQYPAAKSDQNIQPGQIRCRSRRIRCAVRVERQLRALNSPAGALGIFGSFIYNADCLLLDRDYLSTVPQEGAEHLAQLLSGFKNARNLDYGSGANTFAARMRELGFAYVESYDPISLPIRPKGSFDVVACFEVIEHFPWPYGIMADLQVDCRLWSHLHTNLNTVATNCVLELNGGALAASI